MKVTHIVESKIEYDLSKWPKYESKLKPLLPTKTRERMSFAIRNTDTATVNGLRRTLIEELPVKILHAEVSDIDTNEEFLIRDELLGRIRLIPIDQSVKPDSTFTINVVNTDKTKRISYVHSSQISENENGNLADKMYRIAELHVGRYLKVDNIRIIEGYGYMHANFRLTCGVEYRPLDYIDVYRVNERGYIERGMAEMDLVLTEAKKKKSGLTEFTIKDEKILFIPNATNKELMSAANKNKLSSHLVIEKNVKFHSSSLTHPTTYAIGFETLGTMPTREIAKMACRSLAARFQKIYDGVEHYLKDPAAEPVDVNVVATITQSLTQVKIVGESHTVAEVIINNIQKLDPAVANVKKRMIHPLERSILIEIVHGEPIKILMDACKMAIKNYEGIGSAF
jgi:DNA-directed RNA polymerase subunit L